MNYIIYPKEQEKGHIPVAKEITQSVLNLSPTHISLSHKGKIHPKNNMYIPLMSDSSFLLCGFN